MRQEDEYRCNEHSSRELRETSGMDNTACADRERASVDVQSSQGSQSVRYPYCANCDIEILWSPTIVQGETYCCTGCAGGGPCCCDYSLYRSVTISGVIHYGPQAEVPKESSDKEAS